VYAGLDGADPTSPGTEGRGAFLGDWLPSGAAAATVADAGRGAGEPLAPKAVPQFAQNFAMWLFASPHAEHRRGSGTPHCSQNLAAYACGCPH
jgi:hypothetical protein